MKYAYYPGCSLETYAKDYDTSMRAVFSKLGIELSEIQDWSCCGSSLAHKVDKDLATLIAGRNLALTGGVKDVVAPCASCFASLKEASMELEHNEELQRTLAETSYDYKPGVRVVSAVEAVYRALKEGLFDGKIESPLNGLKVASYYGCLLVRPPQVVEFDDPENPTSMDEIMAVIGAEAVNWSHKTECCGNSYILVDKDMTQNLVKNILNAAIDADADIVVAACPLCHQNLAVRQQQLQKSYGLKRRIPILYFTQLVGAALNISNRQLGINPDILRKGLKKVKEVV